MKQIKPFGDDRELFFCAHCGGQTGTRDHIPSRVLLDTPYPENLPVVPCCQACNASFSSDEEYFAAFIDCALVGQTEPTSHHRPKVQTILERQPKLVESIQASVRHLPSRARAGIPNRPRLENVVLKLARGHAAFELRIRCTSPVLHERVNCRHLGAHETKYGSSLGRAYRGMGSKRPVGDGVRRGAEQPAR